MHTIKRTSVLWRVGSAVTLSALFIIAGCEGEPDDNEDYAGVDEYFEKNPYDGEDREDPGTADLEIDPVLQMMSKIGSTAIFQGKGGVGPYTWSVSNPDCGSVESLGWSEAMYTCLKVGDNNVIVIDEQGHMASAIIQPEQDTLTIYPASIDLIGAAYYASFSVSGGAPPYSWTVGNVGMGTISYSASDTQTAGYTAVPGTYGVNVVTVTDSEGRVASATVTQTSDEE
jgi:hypothetical protein